MQCFNANETVSALVADTVLKHMKKGGTGEVLMVNSAGVYLSVGDDVWLLCDASWGMTPIGIAIDGFLDRISKLNIEQGCLFEFRENTMIFSGRDLRLEPISTIKNDCSLGRPQLHLINQAARDIVNMHKDRGISMLVLPLVLNDFSEDVTSLNPYCKRAYPILSRLVQALTCESEEDIRECVSSLLGLGTGLTPSADDVLLGMLYAFRKLGTAAPQSVSAFRASVANMCDSRTNKVSAAYLKAVLSGAYFERIERVWRGLCGAEPLDTSAIFEIGSSSGTEMLLGVLIAARACERK